MDSENSEDQRVLLFKHDEMNKNLFKKYIEKHKLKSTFVASFKELLTLYKV